MGGGGGWAPALDRLRSHEDPGRRIAECRVRRDDLHPHRLRWDVFSARCFVLVADAADDRYRTHRGSGAVMAGIVAFWLIAGMLAVYTVLDGYDLGAGAISLILARTRPERSAIVESIGPFWSG